MKMSAFCGQPFSTTAPWHLQCQKWCPVRQILSKENPETGLVLYRVCLKTIKQYPYSSRFSICFMITKLDMFVRENLTCQKKKKKSTRRSKSPRDNSANSQAIRELGLRQWPQVSFWSTEVSGKVPQESFFIFIFILRIKR